MPQSHGMDGAMSQSSAQHAAAVVARPIAHARNEEPAAQAFVTGPESPMTWANLVTALRGVLGIAIFTVAAFTHSEAWNFAGLAVYWLLDVADGFLARRLDQETRLGAQMDILCDRLLVTFFYLNYVWIYPELLVPVVLFLFQFMGIDHYLSNQFMRWPVKSPNYFYEVDRVIWLHNWSVPGKLLNSAVVTGLLVLTKSPWLVSAVAVGIIGLKIYSCIRLHRLPAPEPAWARPAAS